MNHETLQHLTGKIRQWGTELGFQHIGICDVELSAAEQHLHEWLNKGFHGQMQWMGEHGHKRTRAAQLVPGTIRVISARMDYFPDAHDAEQLLTQPQLAYVSRYALGRDYHKLLRKRLQQLATRIENSIGEFGYRVFVDSAPVMEKPLAQKAGLGWIGKHSNLIDSQAGSWFFLGEIYVDIPLPVDETTEGHCGTCTSCIEVCPTRAIVEPYVVDARRCISYLTIELKDAIPLEFRKAIGNRIYGCDDCQLCCPWNRFSQPSREQDFQPRHRLDQSTLLELFNWDEQTFLNNTEGSAIRRIGYQRWMRNLAVALGNAPASGEIIQALHDRQTDQELGDMVQEHIDWALQQHNNE